MTELADGPGVGLPLPYKRNAWILALLLLAGGCVISLSQTDWGWLARSGALVTIAALIAGSFNTSIESKFVIDAVDEAYDPSQEIYEAMREKPHLYGISRPLTETQTRDIVAKERDQHKAKARAVLQNEMNGALKKLELQIAALGAFTWGFADLLNKIC